MASIKTIIELSDCFSAPMMNVINSANAGVSAMDNIHAAMNSSIDTTAFDSIQAEISKTIEAADQLDTALSRVDSPSVSLSADSGNVQRVSADAEASEIIRVQAVVSDIIFPENIRMPVEAVITNTGIQRQTVTDIPVQAEMPSVDTAGIQDFRNEIAQAELSLSQLRDAQMSIDEQSRGVSVIPEDMQIQIEAARRSIENLGDSVSGLFQNPLDLNTDEIQQELAKVNGMISEITNSQTKLCNALQELERAEPPPEFDTGNAQRYQNEINRIAELLHNVSSVQESIKEQSKTIDVIPKDVKSQINTVNQSILQMEQALNYVRENPFDLDARTAQLQITELNRSIKETLNSQSQLNGALQELSVDVTVNPNVPEPLVEQPEPLQIQWQSDTSEVFTGTGIERFQQEVQNTNAMLNNLNQTQSRIAAKAAQTNLFPANAVNDINNMQSRLQAIGQRIQAIENNPLNLGTDSANAQLEQLRGQLDKAVQEQRQLNSAVEQMDVQSANEAYLKLSGTIGSTERYIRDNTDEQGRFNSAIEEGTKESNQLINTIKSAAAAYVTMQSAGKVIDLSDTMTQTTARLDLIVDDGGSVEELQNKIYASAQNARGSYMDMASIVARFGSNAGEAFENSNEVVDFAELVQKQMTIAGTSTTEASNAMLQLSQALASGVLRGDELNSIFEQAPNLIQSIADYMGVGIGEIRDMASEGQITADIVKAAMFSASDEINAKFESMPMTFSQLWTSFQNTALMAFQPVLEQISAIANSEDFQVLVNNAVEALSMVAGIALEIFDLLVGAAGAAADNWSWLSPIIYGAAGALAVYYGWLLLTKGAEMAMAVVHGIVAVSKGIMAAAAMVLTGATWAETTAQYGLNAAMYACPIVWIIVLIIALVALFYAAVAAINKFAGTSISATGIICGVFMTAVAFIWNRFAALINFIIDGFARSWNFIAAFVNFLGNAWNDPIGSIARLFRDLVDTILSLLESLASAIDTIFGSNLADAVSGWRDDLGEWVDETYGQGEEIMTKINAEDYHLDRFNYKDAWDKGYNFGKGIDDKISNFDPSSLFDTNVPNLDDYSGSGDYGGSYDGGYEPELSGIGSGVEDIAGNTDDIADDMDITEEELKYLRDIAEQETVNRFTTAAITIEQTNNNNISSDADLDGILNGLTDAVEEAASITAEGVHV